MEYQPSCLSILGSTGSIGTQALDIVRKHGYMVAALAANTRIELLECQIREFKPKLAAVMDQKAAALLRTRVADTPCKILSGMEGLCEAASTENADTVLNAVVGMIGLHPTIAAVRAGKRVALANKETLAAGGDIVMRIVRETAAELLPVDSEHSAVFQCLQAAPPGRKLQRIILTASGGPFFGKTKQELKMATKAQALKHPNWRMGAKITVDSATMMNKGLEIMEAVHLFGLSPAQVDVVIHRESIIHSLVEFEDHSVLAQLGLPDMRIPIQYAFTYPNRMPSLVKPLDFTKLRALTFDRPDEETFTCMRACKRAIAAGGLRPAAANGANEEAVKLFLEDRIGFSEIGELVESAMERQADCKDYSLDDVFEADAAARRYVRDQVKNH